MNTPTTNRTSISNLKSASLETTGDTVRTIVTWDLERFAAECAGAILDQIQEDAYEFAEAILRVSGVDPDPNTDEGMDLAMELTSDLTRKIGTVLRDNLGW